jgi:ribonuclease Y
MNMEIFKTLFSQTIGMKSIIMCVVGAGVGFLLHWMLTKFFGNSVSKMAARLKEDAKKEAEHIIREGKVSAKAEMLKLKDQFEKETKDKKQELTTLEKRLASREEHLEKKADIMDAKTEALAKEEKNIVSLKERISAKEEDLKKEVSKQLTELERISQMNREEAKNIFLEKIKGEVQNETGHLVRNIIDEMKTKADREVQKILISAMQRYAGECAYEHTTSTVPLPGDEMKGRIIGREGRNIRALEAATGVSLLVDDTPEAVVLSCFNPVRREKARILLERLIADGRIHPTRIEDLYKKVDKEVEDEMAEAGDAAVLEIGVRNLPDPIVKTLGRLKYRYSFSQNVLRHSVETANFMGVLASELSLNVQLAKRIGLLHDIGKALDSEAEGSHALLGAELLKKYNESEELINAVSSHHEETEKKSVYAVMICICDALSASRPGARSETAEFYIKRLEKLEEVVMTFPGVDICHVIQAGKEVRVVVNPTKISEAEAQVLSRDICQKIEKEMNYPGQIKVTVIRETRTVEYAK